MYKLIIAKNKLIFLGIISGFILFTIFTALTTTNLSNAAGWASYCEPAPKRWVCYDGRGQGNMYDCVTGVTQPWNWAHGCYPEVSAGQSCAGKTTYGNFEGYTGFVGCSGDLNCWCPTSSSTVFCTTDFDSDSCASGIVIEEVSPTDTPVPTSTPTNTPTPTPPPPTCNYMTDATPGSDITGNTSPVTGGYVPGNITFNYAKTQPGGVTMTYTNLKAAGSTGNTLLGATCTLPIGGNTASCPVSDPAGTYSWSITYTLQRAGNPTVVTCTETALTYTVIDPPPYIITKEGDTYLRDGFDTPSYDVFVRPGNTILTSYCRHGVDTSKCVSEYLLSLNAFPAAVTEACRTYSCSSKLYDQNNYLDNNDSLIDFDKLKTEITYQATIAGINNQVITLGDAVNKLSAPGKNVFIVNTGSVTIPAGTTCNTSSIFFINGNLTVNPNFLINGYTTGAGRDKGCMFVVSGDLNINAGAAAGTGVGQFDVVHGFFILTGANSKVNAPKDGFEKLRIIGGVVTKDSTIQDALNRTATYTTPPSTLDMNAGTEFIYEGGRYLAIFDDLLTDPNQYYSIKELQYIVGSEDPKFITETPYPTAITNTPTPTPPIICNAQGADLTLSSTVVGGGQPYTGKQYTFSIVRNANSTATGVTIPAGQITLSGATQTGCGTINNLYSIGTGSSFATCTITAPTGSFTWTVNSYTLTKGAATQVCNTPYSNTYTVAVQPTNTPTPTRTPTPTPRPTRTPTPSNLVCNPVTKTWCSTYKSYDSYMNYLGSTVRNQYYLYVECSLQYTTSSQSVWNCTKAACGTSCSLDGNCYISRGKICNDVVKNSCGGSLDSTSYCN